jgi:hypothetical protein
VETMQDPQLMAQLNATIPLGRMADPEEIADLVVWLASDRASYVTATTFFVDGGMMQFSPGLEFASWRRGSGLDDQGVCGCRGAQSPPYGRPGDRG